MSQSIGLHQKKLSFSLPLLLLMNVILFISIFYAEEKIYNLLQPLIVYFSFWVFTASTPEASKGSSKWKLLRWIFTFYVIIDSIWALMYFTGFNPEIIENSDFLYYIPNVFFLFYVFYYSFKTLYSKRLLILAMDNFTISFILLIVFMQNYTSLGMLTGRTGIFVNISMLFAFLNLFSISAIVSFYFSGIFPKYTLGNFLFILAILLYNINDLVYLSQTFNQVEIFQNIANANYYAILSLFAVSAYVHLTYPEKTVSSIQIKSLHNFKPIFFILFFTGLFFFDGINLNSYIIIILLLTCNSMISFLWDMNQQKKSLLSQNKEYNLQLIQHTLEKNRALTKVNEELQNLSNKDVLTGLSNRQYLYQYVNDRIKKHPTHPFAVIYMDIIHFKHLNDFYGHEVGDMVLTEMAERLKALSGKNTSVFRVGGDEFVLLMDSSDVHKSLENFTQKIFVAMKPLMHYNGYSFAIQISMGSSMYPDFGTDGSKLVQFADVARIEAKKRMIVNQSLVFDFNLHKQMNRAANIERLLKSIDYDKELSLHYQPKFDAKTKKMNGMEALVRWNSPILGFVSPGEFIPIAEQSNVIIPMGEWILKKAMEQVHIWNHQHNTDYRMSINVSSHQIESSDFFQNIIRQAENKIFNPKWLDLEMTERVAMYSTEYINALFQQVHQIGVTISIDDFGTGYSSLNYISNFQIDKLKIAKELVDYIENDYTSRIIVKAIIMMANAMEIETVAEGVETAQQLKILQDMGCDIIQGYYLGRPFPVEEFENTFLDVKR